MDRKQQQNRQHFHPAKSSIAQSYGHEGRAIPKVDNASHYGRVELAMGQSTTTEVSSNRSGMDVPFFTGSKVPPSQSIKSAESFRPSNPSQHSQQVPLTTNQSSTVQDWRLTAHQSRRNQVINSV